MIQYGSATFKHAALFFPVRKLIWVLYVRKKQKTQGLEVSEEEKKILKKRAKFYFCSFMYCF